MIELGLSRISKLLATTPLSWRAIHVAGTNGKGSICAYVSRMLEIYNSFEPTSSPRPQHIKHGRFTSPHLIDRHDCITINGETIALDVFRRIEDDVLARNKEIGIKATSFELLTATAFTAFAQAKLDIGVIEVGVGGRLDATNIIGQPVEDKIVARPMPLVTAISSLGKDHGDLLGHTMQEIAREKAGIIKEGVPVVYVHGEYSESDVAEEVIARTAEAANADRLAVSADTPIRYVWQIHDTVNDMGDSLSKTVQDGSPNGAMALQTTWTALHRSGRLDGLSRQDKQRLLSELAKTPAATTWPGRMQLIDLEPLLGIKQAAFLDGAHNEQSAQYVAKRLGDYIGHKTNAHFVTACSKGKGTEEIFKALLKPGDALTAVEFGPVHGMPWVRPESAKSISEAVQRVNTAVQVEPAGSDLLETLRLAAASARANNRHLVITGSLYLIGDVLRLLRQHSAIGSRCAT